MATYVVYQLCGFLIHGLWLEPVYQEYADVFGAEEKMDALTWVLLVTSAVLTSMFCYIFSRGHENCGTASTRRSPRASDRRRLDQAYIGGMDPLD